MPTVPIDPQAITDKRPMSSVMTVTQMFPHQWLSIPHPIREKIAEKFKVKRSSHIEVHGSTLITDGRTAKDLSVVNVESMQKYLKSQQVNFSILLEELINKIANE